MNLHNVQFVIQTHIEHQFSLDVYAKISSSITVKDVQLVTESAEPVKKTPQTVLHALDLIDQIISQRVFVYQNFMMMELVMTVLVIYT